VGFDEVRTLGYGSTAHNIPSIESGPTTHKWSRSAMHALPQLFLVQHLCQGA